MYNMHIYFFSLLVCLGTGKLLLVETDSANSTNSAVNKTSRGEDYHSAAWHRYPGSLMQVDIGKYGVWGVDTHHHVYKKTGNGWQKIPGGLKQISVGEYSAWGVNGADQIFRRVRGGNWQHIHGSLKQVSVSVVHHQWVWGVSATNEVFVWKGGHNWKRIPGSLSVVSVGYSGVWGINWHQQIFFRKGTYRGALQEGTGWQLVDGALVWISVGYTGEVWGIDRGGLIWKREGISGKNHVGTIWRVVPGRLIRVSPWKGQIWGVNEKHEIFYRNEPYKLVW